VSERAGRIALVHDWLNQIGGAEYVLETLARMFPRAPIYTSMYAPEKMPPVFRSWDIRTTFMQRLPAVTRRHQMYMPVYPLAFQGIDLSGYDLILSNKSGFCHGVRPRPGAKHVCYCLAPTRFLWQYESYAAREALGKGVDLLLRPMLDPLRRWDYEAAQRVNHFIAISREIQDRIRRYYRRESIVIYPPVDVEAFRCASEPLGDYFLAGGRLIPYKRTDLAVAACSELGLRLLVFGEGRDRAALQRMAGPSVTFLGRVPAAELARLYAGARAFIFPGLEDFGIAPVEAQATGRPVLAYAGGGSLDSVIPGQTGEFFEEQTVESLKRALSSFRPAAYNPADCRRNAERFREERFVSELRDYLELVG
jgi:glycosyltransferase involved in cell wall biosynthesis